MEEESGSSQNPDEGQHSVSQSPRDSGALRSRILIVEDNPADLYLVKRALNEANISADLVPVSDGEMALDELNKIESIPSVKNFDLILLDLNLPRMKGWEVVEHMKKGTRTANIPVIVVTSSDNPRDREKMNSLGVSQYFLKVSEFAEFMRLGPLVSEVLKTRLI